MAFGGKSRITKNNTGIENKQTAVKPSEKFQRRFSRADVDLNNRAIRTLIGKGKKATKYKTNTNYASILKEVNGIEKKISVNEDAIHVMKNIGIYGISEEVPPGRAAVFKFQQQDRIQNSTADSAVSAWRKIMKMQKNKTGALYAFDLETFGGTLQDKRWSPAGITEFAMIKHDFATGERSVHNVLMTDNETVAQLENYLERYKDIMNKGGIEKLKQHNDLYVFAMRMSLYDPDKEARFSINDKGLWQVDALLDTELAQAGNVDSVTRAVNKFIDMNKELKTRGLYYDEDTGMARSTKEFMTLTGEMYSAMNNNTGVIMGHNIINFDRSINDKQVRQVYNMQLNILNSDTAKAEDKAKAQNAIDYMDRVFGGNVGFGFKKGSILDTLYPTRHAISHGVIEAANAELGTLADLFYKEQSAAGTKHVAVHDTMLNMMMVLDKADGLNGKSLMDKMMGSYSYYNKQNEAISLNSNQLFKVVNNTLSSDYSGKGFANFRKYKKTGEIFTSGGYRIDPDGSINYDKYAGNTGLNKGGFYTVGKQGFLNLKELDQDQVKQLRETYTDLSGDKIFYTSLVSHNKSDYANPHEVFLFASSIEEMEGILGSSLAHVADITETGYKIIEKNKDMLRPASFDSKTGQYLTKLQGTDTDIVLNAIKLTEKRAVNNESNAAVFTGKQSLRNISGLLDFDKEIRNMGYGAKLDEMKKDGVSLTTILARDGKHNGVQYFDEKDMKKIRSSFDRHLGYGGRTDQRSLIKISAAYEKVMSEKDYHENVITAVKEHFNTDTVTGKNANQMNEYFLNLNKMAKVDILKKAGYQEKEIINAVINATDEMAHEHEYFKNVYDFKVGKTFKKMGKISETIENPFSLVQNGVEGDILTFNLAQSNADKKFVNKVYELYLGDKANNKMRSAEDTEKHKAEAMYFFLKDLHLHGDTEELYKDASFKKYMLGLFNGRDNERPRKDFDANIAVTHLQEAIQNAKDRNNLAGILNTVKSVSVLNIDPEIAGHLNKASAADIKALTKKVKTPQYYDDKTREKAVEELLQVFGIDDFSFNENTAHLEGAEKKTAELIRKLSNDQMRGHLDDLLQAAEFSGMNVHYDPLGKRMFLEKGGRVEELTKMPTIFVDDIGKIHLKSGGSDINVGISFEVVNTKEGKRLQVRTNLNSEFGQEGRYLGKAQRQHYKGGEMKMTEFNDYIGISTRESYKDTRHSGLKSDKTVANLRANTQAADELMYDLLSPTGDLNYLLDDYTFIDDELIQKLHPYMGKMKIDSGKELPPDLAMVLQPDRIGLTTLLIDKNQKYADEILDIMKETGYSLKETALVKGKIQIGDRVIGTLANMFDNASRPPMTGAGTVNDILVKDIEKLGDKFGIIAGTAIETEKTKRLIYKKLEDEELTTEFRGRQAYLSNPVIYERMIKQKKSILEGKGKINNMTIKDMTNEYLSEVYDYLTETLTSGTYEQSRFGDSRVFNNILNMPVDVQYLSVNKDIMESIGESTTEAQFDRLNKLMGSIKLNEKTGNYEYTRRAGTIVQKSEELATYVGYGGVVSSFGSKHEVGVMSFSISDNRTELSEAAISKIINDNRHVFDSLDNEDEQFRALLGILETKGLKTTFKIADVNQGSLYKVQDAGVEKGMTLLPNVAIGAMNDRVREYMMALEDGSGLPSMFVKSGFVPHEDAFRALHEDMAEKKGITVEELVRRASTKMRLKGFEGFKSFEDVLSLQKDEQGALAELVFGEKGAFHGYVSVANDNILGHDNAGLATFGLFSEAVYKYSQVTGKSMQEATEDVVEMMKEDDGKNNFISIVNGSARYKAEKGNFKVDERGTLILDMKAGQTLDYDNTAFKGLLKRVDEEIVKHLDDPDSDENRQWRLVHKNIWGYDKNKQVVELKGDEKGEVIGSFLFKRDGDKLIAEGGSSYASHAIIRDSETRSGVSQRYINNVKRLNELKAIDPSQLTEKDLDELEQLYSEISAEKEWSKFVTVDDQMLSVLSRERINDDTEKSLTDAIRLKDGKEQYITAEKMAFLTRKTGGVIDYDASTGRVKIKDELKNASAYQGLIDELKQNRYYNPAFDTQELTEDMLEREEFSHLKDVYERVVTKGRADKIGVESAENIYTLMGMQAAAEFNNKTSINMSDVNRLVNDHNYEVMHIKDYVPREGMGAEGVIESVRDKRLLIDLGDHLPESKRYVAVPAGGQMIGDMDALLPVQGKLNALKRQYEIMESLEGGGRIEGEGLTAAQKQMLIDHSETSPQAKEKFDRAVEKTLDLRNEMIELTDSYARKDTNFTEAYKIVVPEAAQRSKILSVTDTATTNEALAAIGSSARVSENSATFMSRAKIQGADGKYYSLGEMSEKGLHYDYERVGIEEFKNAGYFLESGEANPEKLQELGLKDTDELIEYLETHGSAVVAMRYPIIDKGSMFVSRQYLDRSMNGLNAKSVSAAAMGKLRGDSDGDSESSFRLRIGGATFDVYERQRQLAIEDIQKSGGKLTEDTIRERVVLGGKLSEDTYNSFLSISTEMDILAAKENAHFAAQVRDGILGDIGKNRQVGTAGSVSSQFKGAESITFKEHRMASMHLQPTGEEVNENAAKVREGITQALQMDSKVFGEELLQTAQDISEGKMSIKDVRGHNKYLILDKAMQAMESDADFMKTETFGQLQEAMIHRARISQVLEEGMSKSTKSVIGSVNKTLNASKIIANEVFAVETINGKKNDFYKPDLASVLHDASYWIEQKVVISGKKEAFEPGDTRVLQLEDILKKVEAGQGSQDIKDELTGWLNKYMLTESSEETWANLAPSTRKELEAKFANLKASSPEELENLKVQEMNKYFASNLVDGYSVIARSGSLQSSMHQIKRLGGNSSFVHGSTSSTEAMELFGVTEVMNIIRNIDPEKAQERFESDAQKFAEVERRNLDALKEKLSEVEMPKPTQTKPTVNAEPSVNTEQLSEVGEQLADTVTKKLLSSEGGHRTLSLGQGLGLGALGVAAGLMVAGYAGGGHSRPTRPQDDSQPVEVTPMLDDQGQGDTGMRQQGYIININADTRKGARHLKQTMKDMAKASKSNGGVSINMNYRTTSGGGYSNKDIENIINNFI